MSYARIQARTWSIVFVGETNRAQTVGCHRLDHRAYETIVVFLAESPWNAVGAEKPIAFLEHNFRRAFREEAKSAFLVLILEHRRHRFSHRVERVDFEDAFLRIFVAYRLVALAELENKAEKAALCFIADLLAECLSSPLIVII